MSAPVYDQPPPSSNSPPPQSDTPLGYLDTDYLVKVRRELSLIPGDATSNAHIVALLRSLISRELLDPARIERDKALAEQRAADAKAKAEADLKAKQEAEKAALIPAPTPEEVAAKQAAELERKHAKEQAALARQHTADDLAEKQAEERKALDQKQADERGSLLAEDDLGDAPAGPGDDGVHHSVGPPPAPPSGPVFDRPPGR